MQDFTKLLVWQKSHNLTVNIYKLTSSFPNEEKFGLTNQIRRASVSIESNIAEGCGRNGDKEFSRFLDISQGSCFEVKCQVYIARDLEYISLEKATLVISKIDEVMRMIHALNQKLKAKSAQNEVLKARLTRVSLLKAACS